ncbi:MAG: hypothetical protein Q9184_003020 [Pyrenodesmia sp. 2 TL-2023]
MDNKPQLPLQSSPLSEAQSSPLSEIQSSPPSQDQSSPPSQDQSSPPSQDQSSPPSQAQSPPKTKPPIKPLYPPPKMAPPPPTFASAYATLLASQSELKASLSLLYRENRRLRALLASVPESSIPISTLDVRDDKDAPQLKNLVDPSEQDDYDSGKMDAETFNGRRILGAIEIDCESLGDEIEVMEKENEMLRKKEREREAKKGSWKGGKETVGLEEEKDKEGEKVGGLSSSDVIDFGFEGGKKVMSDVEGKACRQMPALGLDGEDEVVGSAEDEEKEMAAIRAKLKKLTKGVAGVEKNKITTEDVEDELKTLEENAKDGGAAADTGVLGAGGSKSTAETEKEKEEEISASDQSGESGKSAQNESDSPGS